uniref:Pericentrin-like isoform X5 n=1 Tax=Phascolarctos cinereus TaxID=38626 RepID=A0A6P5JP95_PHACI|nr:pericentrin-like isoform X5 [Phascolarctos cinereus]
MMDQLEKDKGFEPRAWQKHGAGEALPPALEKLQGHHSQLENLRQQLLHVSGLLSSFMNQTLNRTINDWTSSDQKAAMSLLFTLEELKSELMSGLTQMEKSYLHFLPAESSLKALIYQNRYLQLLIQGFQDFEQETLSMVAHLGVYPSNKTHKWALTSCPFHQFGMEVGVVISILCFILFIYLFLSR